MSGGMEDCGKLFESETEKQNTVNAYDYEKVIDAMHASFMEYAGKTGKQRNHPSREVYGAILDHARLWKLAVEALNKDGGTDAH